MIFQDPMTAMTPVHSIGWQIAEQIRAHDPLSRRAARARAVELLATTGMPNPALQYDRYPHQLSGGLRQRAMIAMALSCNPSLLIADEPTTALDVTVQAQILDLLDRLRREFSSSIILITHDMGVVAELADRVMVMYAGRLVERGATNTLFAAPGHPYTRGLLGAIPPIAGPIPHRLASIPGTPPSPGLRCRPAVRSSHAARYASTPATQDPASPVSPAMRSPATWRVPCRDTAHGGRGPIESLPGRRHPVRRPLPAARRGLRLAARAARRDARRRR